MKIKNLTLLVITLTLISTLSGCAAFKPSPIQREINATNSGDENAVSAAFTVQRQYCLGSSSNLYDLYETSRDKTKCIFWTKKAFELAERNKHSIGYVYPYAINDLAQGVYSSDEMNNVLNELQKDYSHDARLMSALFGYYDEHPYLTDKDKEKRFQIASDLCNTYGYMYCAFYANHLYENEQYEEALVWYENKPLYSNGAKYSYNLTQLYLTPPEGIKSQPKKAVKALEFYYGNTYSSCTDKYSKSHDKCKKIKQQKEIKINRAKLEVMFLSDESLPDSIREDKYKLALANHLKSKQYSSALIYFEFLERINYQLPASMLFFKAEAQLNTGETKKAKMTYLTYIKTEGKSGNYYRAALQQISKIDAQ